MPEQSHDYRDDGVYLVRVSPNRERTGRLRWTVDAYYRGHRAATGTCCHFGRQEDAELCAARLWGDYVVGVHTAPDAPPRTLSALLDRFCARETGKRGRELSDKTPRSYRSQIGSLLRVAGAECPIGHLTKGHVLAAMNEPHQRKTTPDGSPVPKSPVTKERVLVAVQAMVAFAIKKGWLANDITAEIEYTAGDTEMRPYLQPEEIEAYLAACPPAHRIRSGLILETGLRAGEASHLRWAWIQQSANRPALRVPKFDPVTGFKAKGKRVRVIPLSARAQVFLAEAAERWGTEGFVLHDQAKAPDSSNWCDDTHTGCRRGGVTDTDTHGLRRTAGALWLFADLDIYQVSRLLGHQSVVTTEKSYAGIATAKWTSIFDHVDARSTPPAVAVNRATAVKTAPQPVATTAATRGVVRRRRVP